MKGKKLRSHIDAGGYDGLYRVCLGGASTIEEQLGECLPEQRGWLASFLVSYTAAVLERYGPPLQKHEENLRRAHERAIAASKRGVDPADHPQSIQLPTLGPLGGEAEGGGPVEGGGPGAAKGTVV